jgi:hypothetical protein
MNNKDLESFAKIMAVLAEVYDDGRPPSALKVETYFQVLKRYGIDQLKRAVDVMIKTRTFASFPKPAEIIQSIEGAVEDRASLAWADVYRTLQRVGTWQSVRFADPVIHSAIVAMGGWIKLGEMPEKEAPFVRREFENLYRIMANRGGECPDHLPGIHEISNTTKGYEHKQIVDVGKKQLLIEGARP